MSNDSSNPILWFIMNKNINFYTPYLISEFLIKDHYYKIENLKNDLNKYIKINN